MYHFRRRKKIKQYKKTLFDETNFLEFLLDSLFNLFTVSSICLFPPEFEGEYIIQNAAVNSDMMQYSTINITADWIFPYGQCFSRNESNVIVLLG